MLMVRSVMLVVKGQQVTLVVREVLGLQARLVMPVSLGQ